MGSAQGADADREDYVVSVVGIAGDAGNAHAALQRLFGLSESDAKSMLREAPVAVRRGVNRIRAEYFRRALELAGARVEVRDGQGAVVQPQAAGQVAQPSAAVAAPPRPPSAPLTAAAPAQRESARASPFAATLMIGAPQVPAPANDVAKSASKWGDLERPAAPHTAQAQLEADLARNLEAPPWEAEPGLAPIDVAAGPGKAARPASTPLRERDADASRPVAGQQPRAASAAQSPRGPREIDAEPSRPLAGQQPRPAAAAQDPRAPRELDADPAQTLTRDRWNAAGAGQDALGPRELDADAAGPRLSLDPHAGAPHAAHSPPDLAPSENAPQSKLELAVDVKRRESSPRYEAIPAGQPWKAPSAQAVARAQRKQEFQEMQSGLGDLRPSPRPPGGPAPATAPTPRRAPIATSAAARADQLGFWQVAGLAFSGSASRWIGAIAGAGLVLAPLAKLAQHMWWLGTPLLLAGLCVQLAWCVEYQRSVFWATATGDERLQAVPQFHLSQLMRTGIHPLALALMTDILLWVWIGSQWAGSQNALAIASSPALWALGFGPGMYWSIALASAAAQNHVRGIWDVQQSLRALARAPLALGQAALCAALAFALILLAASAALTSLHLDGPIALVIASGLAAALSHGLMGAWMGRTLRARPELFE